MTTGENSTIRCCHRLAVGDEPSTFPPGEWPRVQITSSCHPRWDRNPHTGKLAYESAEREDANQSIHSGTGYPSRLTAGTL
jgi:predicted acyl esterase